MKQFTVGDLLSHIATCKEQGMTMDEIKALPIYLGDDDELNGIHCAWYTNVVDTNNAEDGDLIELINENRCNHKLEKGKAILIS